MRICGCLGMTAMVVFFTKCSCKMHFCERPDEKKPFSLHSGLWTRSPCNSRQLRAGSVTCTDVHLPSAEISRATVVLALLQSLQHQKNINKLQLLAGWTHQVRFFFHLLFFFDSPLPYCKDRHIGKTRTQGSFSGVIYIQFLFDFCSFSQFFVFFLPQSTWTWMEGAIAFQTCFARGQGNTSASFFLPISCRLQFAKRWFFEFCWEISLCRKFLILNQIFNSIISR